MMTRGISLPSFWRSERGTPKTFDPLLRLILLITARRLALFERLEEDEEDEEDGPPGPDIF